MVEWQVAEGSSTSGKFLRDNLLRIPKALHLGQQPRRMPGSALASSLHPATPSSRSQDCQARHGG